MIFGQIVVVASRPLRPNLRPLHGFHGFGGRGRTLLRPRPHLQPVVLVQHMFPQLLLRLECLSPSTNFLNDVCSNPLIQARIYLKIRKKEKILEFFHVSNTV